MSVINPEAGAITNYLWVTAQEGIALALEAVSTAQTLINADYEFEVNENLFAPKIEDITKFSMVNITIASVTSDGSETNFSKTHNVTYNIDCYVRGRDEDDPDSVGSLVPATKVAVQRLQYLCAMVEFGLTKLANFYASKDALINKMMPDKIDLVYGNIEDAEESSTPYAPARFTFVCRFPYDAQDLDNLPSLELLFTDANIWSTLIDPR